MADSFICDLSGLASANTSLLDCFLIDHLEYNNYITKKLTLDKFIQGSCKMSELLGSYVNSDYVLISRDNKLYKVSVSDFLNYINTHEDSSSDDSSDDSSEEPSEPYIIYSKYNNGEASVTLSSGTYKVCIVAAGGGASRCSGFPVFPARASSGGSGACIIGEFTLNVDTNFDITIGKYGNSVNGGSSGSVHTGSDGGNSILKSSNNSIKVEVGGGKGGVTQIKGSNSGGAGGELISHTGLASGYSYFRGKSGSTDNNHGFSAPTVSQSLPATNTFPYGKGVGYSSNWTTTKSDGAIEIWKMPN